MTTGAIVLARMDSRRLPGKVLRPLAGRPILAHVLDRARRLTKVDIVVVATTTRSVDDPIARLAKNEGVEAFRGASDDVAARCLDCADAFGMDRFARICADSPFFDPTLVDRLIRIHGERGMDVSTNTAPRSFPPGASAEVVSVGALRRALAKMEDPEDREHVTRYFYRHREDFEVFNLAAPDGRYAGISLAVDDDTGLAQAEWIAADLEGRLCFASLDEIAAVARRWSERRPA